MKTVKLNNYIGWSCPRLTGIPAAKQHAGRNEQGNDPLEKSC